MKKLFSLIVFGLAALGFVHATHAAGDKGTADEATALTKKAIAYIKANGKDKAYAEFSNPNGQFKDRDLYVFVVDFNGKTLAHGGNAKLIDKNVIDLKDADGKPFIKSFIELAQTKGKGWVDYKWVNPVTKAIEAKSSYVERVDDALIACGIYK